MLGWVGLSFVSCGGSGSGDKDAAILSDGGPTDSMVSPDGHSFVDGGENGGTFRLLSDSPAIDEGVDVGITVDRLGTPIPQGSAPDIGAFEHR